MVARPSARAAPGSGNHQSEPSAHRAPWAAVVVWAGETFIASKFVPYRLPRFLFSGTITVPPSSVAFAAVASSATELAQADAIVSDLDEAAAPILTLDTS
jgi:hypothetical protein